jgi:hypothetical protein
MLDTRSSILDARRSMFDTASAFIEYPASSIEHLFFLHPESCIRTCLAFPRCSIEYPASSIEPLPASIDTG